MLEGIEGVSSFAKQIDNTFIIVSGITLFLFVVTIGSMLYFVYKYRASNNPKENTENIKHYTPIEIAWTVIPTILMMIIFYYGLESLRVQRTMPSIENSIRVKVLAQKWFWTFEYENGKKSNELTVPVDTNVRLVMTAPKNDVLHAFFVPAFRIKEDLRPGELSYLWFNSTKIGKYDIQCAEYCGTRHSYMRSFVNVISKEAYSTFISPAKKENKKTALDLFNDYGCVGCHSLDNSILVGPGFKDNYNTPTTVLRKGVKIQITRDEKYLRNSILNPNNDIVDGFFPNMMPEFKGQIKDKDLDIIIEYFKGIKSISKKEDNKIFLNGKNIIQNNGCLGCHSIDGTKVVGPSFKGIYNRKVTIIREDKLLEILSDEKYIKSSILLSRDDIVKDYPNIMPEFKNILKDEEVDAIVKYLKTLK